jgi:hypothetical protein
MTIWSEEVKTKTIELVALRGGDTKSVSEETGVPEPTIKRWMMKPADRTIPELLEAAIRQMFENMPDAFSAKEWSIALGILMDKYLLMTGAATSRTETITRTLDMIPEKHRDAVIARAREILAEK